MNTADGLDAPPPKREQLAAELRQLRDLAGVSGRDLARRINISQSKVSRIESGNAVPSLPEVRAWGKELGVSLEIQERLASLAEAAYTEVHPWRAVLQRRGHLQDDIQEQESRAKQVREYQHSVVPGLLQTAEYARRVYSLFQRHGDTGDLAAAVAARLHRQLALYEEDREFRFLITEAALRWRPGPAKLVIAQLDRIASISTLENVSIGLIPLSAEATTLISHGFVIYDDEDDAQDTAVAVETIHAQIAIRDPKDVETYRARWELLHRMAIFDDAAREFLAEISTALRAM